MCVLCRYIWTAFNIIVFHKLTQVQYKLCATNCVLWYIVRPQLDFNTSSTRRRRKKITTKSDLQVLLQRYCKEAFFSLRQRVTPTWKVLCTVLNYFSRFKVSDFTRPEYTTKTWSMADHKSRRQDKNKATINQWTSYRYN